MRKKRWPAKVAALLLAAAALSAQAPAEEAEPAAAEFRLSSVDLLDSRGGYAIPADSVFYPGEKVYLGFKIAGYTVDEEYRIDLTWRADAIGPNGVRFAPAEGGEFAVELSPQDENWEPSVEYSAVIPQYAGSGVYTLKIVVTDAKADKTLEREIPVRVEGEDVEISDSLSVRNFVYTMTEGGTVLQEPVFGRGDTVFASFYITGYATDEENRYDVESSLKVVDAQGETVLALHPPGEKGAPFFPRLWLPAKFRLDLDRSIPPGPYTVMLEVKDNVGGKTLLTEEKFRVK
ncbi:MAG: hypothetical protein R2748_24910 [Bryobacterales bacterium]